MTDPRAASAAPSAAGPSAGARAVADRRTGVVGRQLIEVVQAAAAAGTVAVLDCGGGSGRFAVPLAQAGAVVTVVDVSADALSTLLVRAREAGVADRVTAVQGDVESLADALAGTGTPAFALVLAHGVLEAVDDPAAAFAAIAAAVAPGGVLSVLVANPAAAVIARALAGDLDGAVRELDTLDAVSAAGPAGVAGLCAANGLEVTRTSGVGVFREIVPGAAVDLPGAAAALDELEARCASRSPFAEIAAQVHLLARRPA